MAENKTFNEEALVEMAHTMGFDLFGEGGEEPC